MFLEQARLDLHQVWRTLHPLKNYVNKTARPDSLILVLEIDIAASILKSLGRGSYEQDFVVKVGV